MQFLQTPNNKIWIYNQMLAGHTNIKYNLFHLQSTKKIPLNLYLIFPKSQNNYNKSIFQ